jgi:hypothetical protein
VITSNDRCKIALLNGEIGLQVRWWWWCRRVVFCKIRQTSVFFFFLNLFSNLIFNFPLPVEENWKNYEIVKH